MKQSPEAVLRIVLHSVYHPIVVMSRETKFGYGFLFAGPAYRI